MTEDLFKRLAAPFPPDRVSWRVGSTNADKTRGMALAYIDARDVQDRLDAVVGPSGWQRRHPHVNGTTTCEIDIWIEGRGWVTKSDGAGDTAVEAEKGSLSDSFKRAAVNWGVGRYLYALPSPWVELEQRGRSQVIKESEFAKLRTLLDKMAPQDPPNDEFAPIVEDNRLTAFEAKRQGIGEAIKKTIDEATARQLDIWEKNFDRNTAHLPLSWLPMIRERIELRREELEGEAKVAEGAAALDAGFRGATAVRGSGEGSVSRSASEMAAE